MGSRAVFDPATSGLNESVVIGDGAGYRLTATENTHVGFRAGGGTATNLSGTANTTLGYQSGLALTSGANNTLIGTSAGDAISTGGTNTLLGSNAGGTVTTTSNNILIGQNCDIHVNTLSNVIAIGTGFTGASSNTCSIQNIVGVTTDVNDAIAVLVDSDGQLGTVSSSLRYKKDVVPLEIKTDDILALEPKHFKWKKDNTSDFGLIAEEAEQHVPELVVKNAEGELE
jgi:hypothetical protein